MSQVSSFVPVQRGVAVVSRRQKPKGGVGSIASKGEVRVDCVKRGMVVSGHFSAQGSELGMYVVDAGGVRHLILISASRNQQWPAGQHTVKVTSNRREIYWSAEEVSSN